MSDAIKNGRVSVNGEVAESFVQPVEAGTDDVAVDGKSVTPKTGEMVYLMLNKPKGIVSTTKAERGEKTVVDILPPKYQQARVYPVGRLDKDSSGLVLLSNDGDFAYKLTHPKFEREKEYLVKVEGRLTKEEMSRLEKGVKLADGKTAPAKVKVAESPLYDYSVTIHEGRKRQVRRMFVALRHRVLELRRVRIDVLTIRGLEVGDARELSAKEIRSLKRE